MNAKLTFIIHHREVKIDKGIPSPVDLWGLNMTVV